MAFEFHPDDEKFEPYLYTGILLVELTIATFFMFKIHRTPQMNNTLVILFDIVVVTACLTSAGCAIGSVQEYHDLVIALSVWLSIFLMLLCSWVIFIFRLVLTFAASDHAIGKCERFFYGLCFCIMALIAAAFIMLMFIDEDMNPLDLDIETEALSLSLIGLMAFVAIFLVSSLGAMYRFVSSLKRITRTVTGSLDAVPDASDLEQHQRTVAQLTVKYIATFFVAFVSSIAMAGAFLLIEEATYFSGLNDMITLLCLFLQFGSQNKMYRGCCCPVNLCCGWMIMSCCVGGSKDKEDVPLHKLQSGGSVPSPSSKRDTEHGATFAPKTADAKIVFAE